LARAEAQFLAAADAVPADQWKTCPGEGHWSAGELVCHLVQVERATIKNADKLLQRPPKPWPLTKRFHLPMALVEARLIPRKTPIPLGPSLVCQKEEMVAQLREVRARTRVFWNRLEESP
jgi:DinB superfamily